MERVTIPQEVVEFQIVIGYNVITKQFSLSGCDQDPLVSMGMLEWAKHRVQRGVSMAELAQEMQNAPRIAVPGGPLG